MEVCGIIGEWNPFHNGHNYLIQKVKQQLPDVCIVSVMSGPFTQRGEPAIFDKWTRAESACISGVNLVVELPQYWATKSMEYFSFGAVQTLLNCHFLSHLAFGSECGSLKTLQKLAGIISTPAYQKQLKMLINSGIPYGVAQQKALATQANENNLIKRPNDRLALLYLTYLPSKIKPIVIKRNPNEASASVIRQYLKNDILPSQYLPHKIFELYQNVINKGWQIPNEEPLFHSICTLLLGNPISSIAADLNLFDGTEKRYLQACNGSSLKEFIHRAKSRHLTEGRIRRDLLRLISPCQPFEKDQRWRILAADEKGLKLLRKMKKTTDVHLIANVGKDLKKVSSDERISIENDIRRQNLSAILQINSPYRDLGRDYHEAPRLL